MAVTIQHKTSEEAGLNPELLGQFGHIMKKAAELDLKVDQAVFHRAKTETAQWWVQYILDTERERIQFQFFANQEKFPRDFVVGLKTTFDDLNKGKGVMDFVPEANSWYLELPGVAVTSFVAEAVVKKVLKNAEAAKEEAGLL